ncbi:hypothetical protein KEM54_003444, partial [Ascosphaera aggregata]
MKILNVVLSLLATRVVATSSKAQDRYDNEVEDVGSPTVFNEMEVPPMNELTNKDFDELVSQGY